MRYFHFTLGPVQGFVAQARRTRDFWAGSFLLSYLAGVAMREVIEQAGRNAIASDNPDEIYEAGKHAIVFPKPDDKYLRWIDGKLKQGTPPKHGGIPNRFMAKVSDGFQPSKVEKAVKTAWKELAEQVWEKDFGEAFEDPETRGIWRQQIESFWDISWVIVKDEKDTSVLDRRKNWRSHYLPPQKGMKCMAMEGMRELSGATRPGEGKEFWEKLRKSNKPSIATDLRDNERLCAIAYVKRRFVHYFNEKFKAEMPDQKWIAHGWEIPKAVPSVTYIAAAPWLAEALQRADAKALREFHGQAAELAGEGQWERNLKCVRDADAGRFWKVLDGHVFYKAELRNEKLYSSEQAKPALDALAELRGSVEPKLGPPAPYYALLLMDGDSLGKHMSDADKRQLISAALNGFTGGVQSIVEQEYSGFLIYAGGDDVLALLTLDDALPCARALRRSYESAFASVFKGQPEGRIFPATISAAIEYAHYRLPFTKILADAHGLLDNEAKDGRGRDAVAARVWKQSGLHLTWAQPWDIALREKGIGGLVKQLRGEDEEEKTQVAGGFFYRMRDLFKLLNPPKDHPKDRIEADDMVKLLAYEYAHSGIHGESMKPKEAEAFIRPLLEQCRPRIREAGKDSSQWKPLDYQADAALLVRFLANRGNERN
jgi:CRISPR-associated protein Cmr2